jgi:hypothetical protein
VLVATPVLAVQEHARPLATEQGAGVHPRQLGQTVGKERRFAPALVSADRSKGSRNPTREAVRRGSFSHFRTCRSWQPAGPRARPAPGLSQSSRIKRIRQQIASRILRTGYLCGLVDAERTKNARADAAPITGVAGRLIG